MVWQQCNVISVCYTHRHIRVGIHNTSCTCNTFNTHPSPLYFRQPERINPQVSKEYNVLADVWSLGGETGLICSVSSSRLQCVLIVPAVCPHRAAGQSHSLRCGILVCTCLPSAASALTLVKHGRAVTLVEIATGKFPYPKEDNVYSMLAHIVKGASPGQAWPARALFRGSISAGARHPTLHPDTCLWCVFLLSRSNNAR